MVKSINVKVDEDLWGSLRLYEEINWSGLIRSSIRKKLEELETRKFDKKKAMTAFLDCKRLRNSGAFKGGKTGTKIIREWRDKKRY